jgi:hypothetical protein
MQKLTDFLHELMSSNIQIVINLQAAAIVTVMKTTMKMMKMVTKTTMTMMEMKRTDLDNWMKAITRKRKKILLNTPTIYSKTNH